MVKSDVLRRCQESPSASSVQLQNDIPHPLNPSTPQSQTQRTSASSALNMNAARALASSVLPTPGAWWVGGWQWQGEGAFRNRFRNCNGPLLSPNNHHHHPQTPKPQTPHPPVGPRNMNEAIGPLGSDRSALLRWMAVATASTASAWPMMRRWRWLRVE